MFSNDSRIVQIITYAPFIFIPTVVIMIFALMIHANHTQFANSVEQMEASVTETRREVIISQVNSIVNLIEYKQSMANKILQEKVKARVDVAYSIAKNIYDEYKGVKSIDEIKKDIINSLRPLTWNDGESFIFILDFNGVFQLAPTYLRQQEGKSIIDFQDATGRYVIREEIALAKSEGEGYLWDTFTRPGHAMNLQYKQLAYIRRFDGFDWYMGSAEYIDTTQKEIAYSLFDFVRNFASPKEQYFFVLDESGKIIMHGYDQSLVGTNILALKERMNKDLYNDIYNDPLSKKGKFVSYLWENPSHGQKDVKHTYIRQLRTNGWVIATGYYKGELANRIKKRKNQLYTAHQAQVKELLLISILLVAVSLLGSYQLSVILRRRLRHYHTTISAKNRQLSMLNRSLEETVEKRTHELTKAYKQMENIASTDSLTGILNRYAFNMMLKKEMHRANRHYLHFSLILLDLDHFKNVNDTYGHDTGDIVLIEVAKNIQKMIREEDIFARFGGEEFIIILPDTNLDGAYHIAERIRKAIAEDTFGTDIHITLSMGLAEYQIDEEARQLLKRTDNALYKAKNSGRNSVVIAD